MFDFKTNIDSVIKDFKDLKKDIKEQVIQDGFFDTLKKSVGKLKKELHFVLKNRREENVTKEKKPDQESNVIQPALNVPKTKEALVEHFTGVDFKEYNNQRNSTDYYTQVGKPKLVNAQYSKNTSGAARISLKMPIEAGETVETQFIKAKQFFENAIMSFPGDGGDKFVANTLPLLEDDTKIKCSSYTGDHDFDDYGGTSPQRRFELDAENKQYAEWTLKQDYVRRVEATGVNISRIVDNVISGSYDDARNYINTIPSTDTNKTTTLINKVENLESNDKLAPKTQSVNNIIQFINNLDITKTNTKSGARYALTSKTSLENGSDFTFDIQKQIAIWKSTNLDKWIKDLVVKIEKVIKDFYKR